ncbi:MAG: uracil-DNA glycosylase [Hoeflea sp.]|uniref:uracil-DNA glycosylase n=1 Tax=Hoeflea sp. TaxID=1940281 RepID=UPI003EF33BD5
MVARFTLEDSWKTALTEDLANPYMADLITFLKTETDAGKTIFPKPLDYFAALNLTPLKQVKVVILGQDPYHGDGQAHGLCFSVQPDTRTPPSLKNIYKELEADLGIARASHGNLVSWARQGVLLLNSVLTVERGLAASHRGRGWERFTDAVIAQVNQLEHPVVFLLWGAYAQKKAHFVDTSRHLVLKAAHPSPLSAHNGFLGCRHFSQTNAFLENNGMEPIDWRLPASK